MAIEAGINARAVKAVNLAAKTDVLTTTERAVIMMRALDNPVNPRDSLEEVQAKMKATGWYTHYRQWVLPGGRKPNRWSEGGLYFSEWGSCGADYLGELESRAFASDYFGWRSQKN